MAPYVRRALRIMGPRRNHALPLGRDEGDLRRALGGRRVEIVLACGDGDPPLKRGDRVALGLRDEASPTSDALEIVSCDPVFLGGAQPHHWEATAR